MSEAAAPAWDAMQRSIIEKPRQERVIVDAGPGTGKTAVACARVAHLINTAACPAQSVWLISFTRTAVKEIRDRIASHLTDPDALFGIRIATVDSQAWSIHQGFKPDARLGESFDANIEQAIELIERSEDVRAYLDETNHLVVDEAQDLVGLRADLVVALVKRLRPDAGVTVFTDPAQAIYGFAGDSESNVEVVGHGSLEDRLTGLGGFTRASMKAIHRTKSPTLLEIFGRARRLVLSRDTDPVQRQNDVRDAIASSADRRTDKIFDPATQFGEKTFVLFRRRSEALQASSFLHQQKVPHRLRMSGLPLVTPAWVGATLGGFTESVLTHDQFKGLWEAQSAALVRDNMLAAWGLLDQVAPWKRKGAIDMRRLRDVLARSQPPFEFAAPDFGNSGPIIGTIHAAKGRETDDVWLMMPVQRDSTAAPDGDLDEETRVVFVGATRSRSTLSIGRGYRAGGASNLEGSGRVHEIVWKAGMARVEIGRFGDIRGAGATGRKAFASASDALELQERLAILDGSVLAARADCDAAAGFSYRLSAVTDGKPLGLLSDVLNTDLFQIANRIQEFKGGGRRRPPDYLQHLRVIGARTLTLRQDDPELDLLHEPWRSSGIMLVPMVLGYVKTFFPFRR